MTTRTHEAIRVGLRRIIRDPNASISERLQATKLLMQVEGLMEQARPFASTKNKPLVNQMSKANDKELLELIELANREKTE
jgi:hypothetical protein